LLKILHSKLELTWINLCVRIDVFDIEHRKTKLDLVSQTLALNEF